MFVRELNNCSEFIAGDGSSLRELLNAHKGKFEFNYSLAHATVKCAQRTKLHALVVSEVYYILEGEGRVHVDDESFEVFSGSAVYIPPGARQYIENLGECDLKFLCIVDPAWKPDVEEVFSE